MGWELNGLDGADESALQYAFWLLNGDVNSAGDYQSVADELILKANSAVDGGWKNDKWVMLAEIGAGDAWYAEKGQDVLVSAAPVRAIIKSCV